MKVVLFLVKASQKQCDLIAKEFFGEDENFDKIEVFQSERKLYEEIKRDNNSFIGCVVEEGITLSPETVSLLHKSYSGCKIIEQVSF